jgi:hypothetical protein
MVWNAKQNGYNPDLDGGEVLRLSVAVASHTFILYFSVLDNNKLTPSLLFYC